jgi:predicted O-linked N-acetylglucosamine transferase (SPINDLY family)
MRSKCSDFGGLAISKGTTFPLQAHGKIAGLVAQLSTQQTFDLALQHQLAGRLAEAEEFYRKVLAQKADHLDAMHLLGVVALQMGQFDVAVSRIRAAIAVRPDWPEALNNLGIALNEIGQHDQAVVVHRRGLALNRTHAEAHYNLGNALREKGQFAEAIAAYRDALVIKLGHVRAHSNIIFAMLYDSAYDARAIALENRRWNEQHARPLGKFILPHANDRNPQRRLRVGYVSADFWSHASALFLKPLLKNHDLAQVERFCYSQTRRADEMTGWFKRNCEGWRDIADLSDEQVAEQIRADRIDILVDLKLHTAENRLLVFARKPAPVQVTWLGYPGTTGLEAIDYRLSDPYIDPPGMDESVYSEKTIRLPETFWCYDPLDGRDVPVNSLPAEKSGVVTFGCLNNFRKINEEILVVWAQVLRQVERSRLMLLARDGSQRTWAVDRLAKEGIDRQRVVFVPKGNRREYLDYYHRIDLGLDSFPCNGHTTSLDSFWMGVPVVTLVRETAVSRAGWSQLSNLNLGQLAAQTKEEFVRIAVELARDWPRLADLRATLRGRMERSPLMDGPKFARNIESAYRQMWRAWCGTVAAGS